MGLIGRDDLIDDPRLVNCNKMNEAGLNPEVVGILDEALGKMTAEEALKLFKDNAIPIELCQTPMDVYEDQNVWDNDYLVKILKLIAIFQRCLFSLNPNPFPFILLAIS